LLSGLTGTATTINAVENQNLEVGDVNGTGALYVGPGVSLVVDSVQESSVTVDGDLTISTAAAAAQGQSRVSTVNSLNISSGTLNLTNNQLFINYGTGTDPISAIIGDIISGYAGSAWNGTGIDSSTAALNSFHYGLGYADSADPGNPVGLPAGEIEVEYTLAGDANLDGTVNSEDFTFYSNNLNTSGAVWDQGDFNYDGTVNSDDFTPLSGNFGLASTTKPAPSFVVPPQYVATFTDSSGTPLASLVATINWGDGTSSSGAIVSDGDGTFHVVGNHTYGLSGTYSVSTTIGDGTNPSIEVNSTADVAAAAISAVGLNPNTIEVTWANLPILDAATNGQQALDISTSPTFSTGVTTEVLASNVTSYEASPLTPGTKYYFRIRSNFSGSPAGGVISATTPAPTLSISGNGTVVAGTPYTLNLSAQFPADSGGYSIESWTINWGDGSSSQTVNGDPSSVTHTFSYSSIPYDVTATASDGTNTYNVQGGAVTSFGASGARTTTVGQTSSASAITVLPNGDILVAGSGIANDGNQEMVLAEYDENGNPVSSFNSGQIVGLEVGDDSGANALSVLTGGNILLAGFGSASDGTREIALAEFYANGTLDTSWGTGGTAVDEIGSASSASAVSVLSGGNILVAGYGSASDGTQEIAIAEFYANGTLDTPFGSGGAAVNEIGSASSASALSVLSGGPSSGNILVAGFGTTSEQEIVLTEFYSNGTLDTSFGTGGAALNEIGRKSSANAMSVLPSGEILVAGLGVTTSRVHEFALSEFDANGTFDTSFGTPLTAIGSSSSASAVSVLANGDILVAGQGVALDGNQAIALAEYLANGTLDTSFGTAGTVLTEVGSSSAATALAVQPNGTILAAGSGSGDIAVVEYAGDVQVIVTPAPTPPTLSISGATSVVAGQTYTLNLSAQFPTSDGNGDGIQSWTINWGDGTTANPDLQTITGSPFTASTISETHQYAYQSQPYQISATSIDKGDTDVSSNTVDVSVTANPLAITSIGASPSIVTGTSTNLTVTATDTGGTSGLIYTWSTATAPLNITAPTFSANGTNSANATTATFYGAGSYVFLVTVGDPSGFTTMSTIQVLVNQSITKILLSPSPTTVDVNDDSTNLSAVAYDQFSSPMAGQPSFAWTLQTDDTGYLYDNNNPFNYGTSIVGGSSVNYNAGGVAGVFDVTATVGTVVGTAVVNVIDSLVAGSGIQTSQQQGINAVQGQQFTQTLVNFTDSDSSESTFEATINWGDGNSTQGTISSGGSGQWVVNGTYTYDEAGIFQPTIVIADRAHNTATITLTAVVESNSTAGNSTNLVATATTTGTINLKWVDDSATATSYELERSADGIDFNPIGSFTPTSASEPSYSYYEDTNVSPNTAYYYSVQGITNNGPANDLSYASATTAAGGGYSTTSLDTITLDPFGSGSQSTVVLQAGAHYEIQASGDVYIQSEFVSYYIGYSPTDAEYMFGNPASPLNNAVVSGADYGIGIDDSVVSDNKYPYWGPYDSQHVYSIDVVGTGQPLTFNFHDDAYADNLPDGSNPLEVQIFQQLPTTVPVTPLNLAATPQGSNGINISWSTSGDATAQDYLLYRSTTSAMPSTVYQTLPAGSSPTQSFSDTGLSTGLTYYYWIKATNSTGTSGAAGPAQSQINPNTPIVYQPPTAAPVTGTSVALSVNAIDPTDSAGAITYTWTLASEPPGADVQVTDGSSTTANPPFTTSSGSVTATFNEAGNYVFAVTATDSIGMSSVVYIPITVVQTLTSISVQAASSTVYNGGADVVNGSGIDQFGNAMPLSGTYSWSVQSGGVSGSISASTSTLGQATYTAPATADGADTIILSAVGLTGSTTVSVISQNAVTAVANSTDWITLTWTAQSNSSYYQVYRGATAGFAPTPDDLVGDSLQTTSFSDSTVSAGTEYYYQVYAVVGEVSVLVGQASVQTPAVDVPLYPLSSQGPLVPAVEPATISPSLAPSNVYAVGVNDLEILVSWTNNAQNVTGFLIEVMTTGSSWNIVGEAAPGQSNFIVRGDGTAEDSFLEEDVPYFIRVGAVNSYAGNQAPYWTATTTGAYVVPPDSAYDNADYDTGNLLVICGGNGQTMSDLLQGVTVTPQGTLSGSGDSVGAIWVHDVEEGYNAFLTCDPHDGGEYGDLSNQNNIYPSLNPDGSGRIFDEICAENSAGYGYDIGLIGYSHGGGMMDNLSNYLWNNASELDPLTSVVFAATIDAVAYGTTNSNDLGYTVHSPLAQSPAAIWGAAGINYWEPNGYLQTTVLGQPIYLPIHGMYLNGVTNYELSDDHSGIAIDPAVLAGVENATDNLYNQLSF
jgi:uncharacterized delta-60 repeat protein